MEPIEFPEQNVVFAKDQPEYLPLPAFRSEDGQVVSCWRLSARERFRVLFQGRLWITLFTFGRPLQPLLPSIDPPFIGVSLPEERLAE